MSQKISMAELQRRENQAGSGLRIQLWSGAAPCAGRESPAQALPELAGSRPEKPKARSAAASSASEHGL